MIDVNVFHAYMYTSTAGDAQTYLERMPINNTDILTTNAN